MKCPLRSFRGKGTYDQDQSEDLDCLKEECAWWDNKFDGCSILELNRTLYLISEYIERITLNMPYEAQFRR